MNALGGYMSLAAAVVESGRKQNDELFLKSSWCDFLTSTVADYAQCKIEQQEGRKFTNDLKKGIAATTRIVQKDTRIA